MSSWTSWNTKRTPPPRLGYYQKYPEGKFIKKELPGTVVSAYYHLKTNKNTRNQYTEWIESFLSLPTYLVFFTSAELEPWIKKCRKNYSDKTIIIILEEEEWTSTKNFPRGFWEDQYTKDSEKALHSQQLYKIWYEKKEFVKKAIQLNPWNHTDFVWMDAGALRNKELAPFLQKFPEVDRIPIDRILLNNVSPFTVYDENRLSSGTNRISGGVIAGSIEMWKWFSIEYDRILKLYIEQNIFCGKDQEIMNTIVIQNKTKVSLLDSKPMAINPWFYLLHYLGAEERLYLAMRNDKENTKKMSVENYILLSKQANQTVSTTNQQN